jgi:hypothetical protein
VSLRLRVAAMEVVLRVQSLQVHVRRLHTHQAQTAAAASPVLDPDRQGDEE